MNDTVLVTTNLLLNRKNIDTPPINLSLKKKAGLGIYGANGSGKSTLLDTLSGIILPKEGNVLVDGKIGYAMQPEGFQESMSCLDNLYLEASYAGLDKRTTRERIEKYSQACELTSFLNKKVNQLSTGMKVRLMLAASLLIEPHLLLLDESFNALDEESIQNIKSILINEKEKGMSLIFVSHNKEHFSGLCEQILYFPSLREETI